MNSHRFVNIDKTWVHYFRPEIKEHSKQWNGKTSIVSSWVINAVDKINELKF